jgi:hypothetical protein
MGAQVVAHNVGIVPTAAAPAEPAEAEEEDEGEQPGSAAMHAAARSASRRRRRTCIADEAPALHWNVCSKCHASDAARHQRQRYLVKFSTEYFKKLHSVSFSALLHKLGVLDVKPQVQRLHHGVGRGCFVNSNLTSGIIVAWDAQACLLRGDRDAPTLQWLLDEMVANNSWILRDYACMFELGGGPGIVVLPRDAIEHIVRRVRSRDARSAEAIEAQASDEEEAAADERIAARARDLVTLDNAVLGPHDSGAPFEANKKVFIVGTATRRTRPWGPPQPQAQAQETITAGSAGIGGAMPLEAGMFPFLFPHGRGFFDGTNTYGAGKFGIVEYLSMRLNGMFTPFTMHGPYILLMYQLRQAHLLISQTSETAIAGELMRVSEERRARGDPDDGGQEAWSSVVRWRLPPTLPGTPSYFRRQLNEVRAITAKLGMASHVLTLTQNDNSNDRWPEFNEMESLESMYVKEHYGTGSFRDMPVEGARLFRARFYAWFNAMVLDPKGPRIYGKVIAYVIRFESQYRGSMHVHVLLWVDPEDQPRLDKEIIAFLPPKRDGEHPELTRFRTIQETENHHKCLAGACRPDGWTAADGDRVPECRCRKKFPFDANFGATYEDANERTWKYYRPGSEFCWVSTTTAATALTWNAHTNVQRLTTDAFTDYMLKCVRPSSRAVADRAAHSRRGESWRRTLHTDASRSLAS